MSFRFGDFSIKNILSKIINCLTEKEKLTGAEIGYKHSLGVYPLSKDTWDNYKKAISKKATTGAQSIKLDTFYDVCVYTDVSADYFLGFIDTKHKDESAQRVKQEFGLSDDAMERLKKIKNRNPCETEYKGNVSSELVNLILTNKDFWYSLDELLPIYFSLKYHGVARHFEDDEVKYKLTKAFERLIDNICECLNKSNIQIPLPIMKTADED